MISMTFWCIAICLFDYLFVGFLWYLFTHTPILILGVRRCVRILSFSVWPPCAKNEPTPLECIFLESIHFHHLIDVSTILITS